MPRAKKVALVTGRGAESGWALPGAWPRTGATSSSAMSTRKRRWPTALDGLRQLGAEVLYCRADVTRRRRAGDDARTSIRRRFGRLNVLVNNAGVAPQVRADILEATEESFERVMRINLQGPYFLTQAGGQLDDRAAPGGRRASGLHRQHLLDLGHGGLDQPRRVLHLQGRRQHGHAALGRAPGRVRHPGLRDPARASSRPT